MSEKTISAKAALGVAYHWALKDLAREYDAGGYEEPGKTIRSHAEAIHKGQRFEPLLLERDLFARVAQDLRLLSAEYSAGFFVEQEKACHADEESVDSTASERDKHGTPQG